MSSDSPRGSGCCAKPIQSLTTLTLTDGSRIGIIGLEEILQTMHAEGRPVSAATAEEIVERLKEKNYIPFSIIEEYKALLLREYGRYTEDRRAKSS